MPDRTIPPHKNAVLRFIRVAYPLELSSSQPDSGGLSAPPHDGDCQAFRLPVVSYGTHITTNRCACTIPTVAL